MIIYYQSKGSERRRQTMKSKKKNSKRSHHVNVPSDMFTLKVRVKKVKKENAKIIARRIRSMRGGK